MLRAGELPEGGEHSAALFQIIIRPTTGGPAGVGGGSAGSGPLGRMIGKSIVNYSVKEMLAFVYETSEDRLIVTGNLPDGNYDLAAKVPQSDEKHFGQRVQMALESTFALKSRREAKEVDVYVATVARGDAKGRLPIIVVTADTALDLRERCLTDGADEVLFKPVAMDSLFDAIGRMLTKGSGDGMIG